MAKDTKKAKKESVSDIDLVQTIVEKLLSLMGTNSQVSVSEDKENDAVLVEINSEAQTGLLIGSRGETLKSLQTIVGLIFRNQKGDWRRILIDVADWREKQESRLKELAESTLEKVRTSGESTPLYNLTPAERRIVHMTIADEEDIETESVGEGEDRHLVVKLKGK